jgi:hypothetical protein
MDYRQTTCSQKIFNKVFLNGCGQNMQKISNNVRTFANTTSPTPVMRPGDRNSGGGCDCLIEWNFTGSGTNWNSSYVGQQEWWQTASLNQDMLTVQSFISGSNVNLGLCQYVGQKGAAANRQWHGTYGWTQSDGCVPTASDAPSQTKYLTATYDVHFSNLADFDGTSDAGDLTGARTVDATTGLIDSTQISTETIKSGQITPGTPVITYFTNGGAGYNYDIGTGTNIPFDSGGGTKLDSGWDLHCGFPPFGIGVGLGTLADYVATWNSGHSGARVPDITDPNSYSGHATDTLFGTTQTFDAEWSRTDTVVSWDFSTSFPSDNPGAPLVHYSFNGSVTLSDANTTATVQSDAESLLSYWPLNNDAIYPWRTDSMTMYMPLVSRREIQSEISPIGFNAYTINDMTDPVYVSGSIDHYGQTAWEDPNSFFWIWAPDSASVLATGQGDTHFDGTILGKPFLVNPSASVITGAPRIDNTTGSGQVWGWFNFYYNDFRFCKTPVDDPDCGTSPPWELYTYRHGGTLADCDVSNSGTEDGAQFINILPKCSTHWTNNLNAHSIPKGASLSCGIPNLQGVWAVKYAECRPKYPSHNFFRPCGYDRVAIDEDTAQCFVDDLVMLNALPTASCEILLTFTNGFDGIYTGSTQTLRMDTHYDLTLGTKVRDLPSGYFHPFGAQFADADLIGDFGLVGMIRFPQAWSICGREAVTVTSGSGGSGSIITFGNSQPNLVSNNKLTLYSLTMGTLVTASVFRNSDTEFTCSNSFSSSISASRFAQSFGSPDYHWNDTTQKLQYRQGEWNTSNRTGITTSQSLDSCVNGSPCAESVICYSPNGEIFNNGITSWFSGSTNFDEPFGNIRQLNVEFGIIDPFYQAPKTPCSVLGLLFPSYKQDPGTCPDNGSDEFGNPIIYFPPPPFIEAMITTPAGAPALPSGVVWPEMGKPALPGTLGFSFASPTQPWETMAAMANTCGANPGCRFIVFYTC